MMENKKSAICLPLTAFLLSVVVTLQTGALTQGWTESELRRGPDIQTRNYSAKHSSGESLFAALYTGVDSAVSTSIVTFIATSIAKGRQQYSDVVARFIIDAD